MSGSRLSPGTARRSWRPSASTRCRRTACTSPSPESERPTPSPPASWTAWRGTPRRCCPPHSPYTPCRWPAPEAPSACPSAPGKPLLRLHHALAKAGSSVGLAPKKPTSAFRPHLTLAYNNRRRPAAPVVETVSGLRALPAVELSVSAVQLVQLRREGRTYRWDVRRNVTLG
ncbi:2'-5' RNA ligase family protein [Streptomyces sp. NPDC015408]|uniref:2'-5' RNA ligase family protein n=1 Tax=Streptomyces sp. NPDC015408 TaxID=3364956 RepID=UPI0036FC16F9